MLAAAAVHSFDSRRVMDNPSSHAPPLAALAPRLRRRCGAGWGWHSTCAARCVRLRHCCWLLPAAVLVAWARSGQRTMCVFSPVAVGQYIQTRGRIGVAALMHPPRCSAAAGAASGRRPPLPCSALPPALLLRWRPLVAPMHCGLAVGGGVSGCWAAPAGAGDAGRRQTTYPVLTKVPGGVPL